MPTPITTKQNPAATARSTSTSLPSPKSPAHLDRIRTDTNVKTFVQIIEQTITSEQGVDLNQINKYMTNLKLPQLNEMQDQHKSLIQKRVTEIAIAFLNKSDFRNATALSHWLATNILDYLPLENDILDRLIEKPAFESHAWTRISGFEKLIQGYASKHHIHPMTMALKDGIERCSRHEITEFAQNFISKNTAESRFSVIASFMSAALATPEFPCDTFLANVALFKQIAADFKTGKYQYCNTLLGSLLEQLAAHQNVSHHPGIVNLCFEYISAHSKLTPTIRKALVHLLNQEGSNSVTATQPTEKYNPFSATLPEQERHPVNLITQMLSELDLGNSVDSQSIQLSVPESRSPKAEQTDKESVGYFGFNIWNSSQGTPL